MIKPQSKPKRFLAKNLYFLLKIHAISHVMLLCFLLALLPIQFVDAQSPLDGPVIDVWYGDEQIFGQYGNPQIYINILGNVSDPDGISSLSYTLNGGSSISLSIGEDGRRLKSTGDFNVDPAIEDLIDGVNTIVISATDNSSNQSQKTVTVNYTSGNVWPLPYTIDWQSATGINDVANVVDGDWEITSEGVHTVVPGYDRLIGIGDIAWADYEVTVPVTVHYLPGDHGIGILFRWTGHTDDPVNGWQPKTGWFPLGAICWYRNSNLEIYGNGGSTLASQSRTLDVETTYIFKARVETVPGIGGLYSFKMWEQGTTEPTGWDITGQETLSDPQNGSLLLLSHKADVTFGNPDITPIPPSITNVQASVHNENTSATISWNTNTPASSQVKYGLDEGYGLGTVSDPTLKTSHSLELTNLDPDTEYHYQVTSVTGEGALVVTGDKTFFTVSSNIISDDFHLPNLNTDVWTWVDPVGNCSYEFLGTNTEDAWLNISVPAGTEHEIWINNGIEAPHIRQSCNDADFEVEVKFESPLNTPVYEQQGILVRQDDDTFLRLEFFSRTGGTTAFAASFIPGGHQVYLDDYIFEHGIAPMYMRVKRQTDLWTMSYSLDGINWEQAALFTFDMTVNTIGPYCGNAIGSSSPAHTASIDYFFNTDSPVVPEDPIGEVVAITSIPVTNTTVGALYTYDVDATGTPAPTYSLLTAPTGMTIDPSTGLIEWTPSTAGDFDVSVEATNTLPSSDVQDFQIHVVDLSGQPVSDDFSSPILDESIWTFIDPSNEGEYSLSGSCTNDSWINITVPGGDPHELWTNGIQATHILQPAANSDFELEVKFESSVNLKFQEQGILIKESETHFLRFEFYSDGTKTKVIAGILGGSSQSGYPLSYSLPFNEIICNPGVSPLFMRVYRNGDQWTQFWSLNGIDWNTTISFSHSMDVTAVGTYAGSAGNNPGHTSSVDYFFNTAAPITPEDAPCSEWTGSIDQDWNNSGNWTLDVPNEDRNAYIPNVGESTSFYPEINGPANCKNLIVKTGASLDIAEDGQLTVYGAFLNNGMTTIHSDGTGTGSLIDNRNLTGTGTTTVERYLLDNRWNYVSAPVNDPTANVFLGMYLMEWDEPSGKWGYITDPGYTMTTDMEGFGVWTDDPGTVYFTGKLQTGPLSINTTNTFGASHNSKGYNFVGNPYPSGLDWNVDDGNGWTRTAGNIEPKIWIYNNSEQNYGVYIKGDGEGTNEVNNIIAPHQGFFVHCTSAIGYLGVENGARVHTSKNILKKGYEDIYPTLILRVSGNNFSDEIILRLNHAANIGYDPLFDAYKFRGAEEAPQFYSLLTDNTELSINTFPKDDSYSTVPLGLDVGLEDIYTILVNDLYGFGSSDRIFLEDLQTGVMTELQKDITYDFTADPEDVSQRFLVHFDLQGWVPQYEQKLIHTYAYGNTIYVAAPPNTTGTVSVHNILGQKIAKTTIQGEKTTLSLDRSGCYIVRVNSDNGFVSEKVIVQ